MTCVDCLKCLTGFVCRVIASVFFVLFAGILVFSFVGYDYEGTVENVPCPTSAEAALMGTVRPNGSVGVSDEAIKVPDYPSFVNDFILQAELTVSWTSPVWYGLVTEQEKEDAGCSSTDVTLCDDDDMEYTTGGPSTATSNTLTWEIKPGSYYVAGGAPADGGDDAGSIDVKWSATATIHLYARIISGVLCFFLLLFILWPCIKKCRGQQPSAKVEDPGGTETPALSAA